MPGRYVAMCFVPQGSTTIEVIEEMIAAEEAAAASSVPGGSAPEGSAPMDTAPVDTAPMATHAEGTAPADGSAPAGRGVGSGAEGRVHHTSPWE